MLDCIIQTLPHARGAVVSILMALVVDLIDDMLNNVSVKSYPFPTICQNPADLLDSSTRPEIRCSHPKDNMIHKRKGIVQHESLHLSVVISTPIGAGEERPADLKFARLCSVPKVP